MQNVQQSTRQKNTQYLFIIAWILGLIFYFIDYVTRSAPSLMFGELANLWSIDKKGVVNLVGTYYITYSVCALVAGICLDKFGAKYSMFAGSFILGIGCILFVLSSEFSGTVGRLLQGAGSAFAFPGCVYLIAKGFSSKHLATAIGFTQCIGMLGGAAGQFAAGPILESGLDFKSFWIQSGIYCIIPAIAMLLLIPKNNAEERETEKQTSFLKPFKIVFSNKDSWLCGIISGLLFAPTTIFFMTWAVAFFENDLQMDKHSAVLNASMAALGWVIGCPLMGYLADKIGKRRPVLIAGCLGMIIMLLQLMYLQDAINIKATVFIFGVFSGVAMIPYSIIKEVNPDSVKGSATGVQNFITFGVTTALGPLFAVLLGNKIANIAEPIQHFNQSIWFWLIGTAVALVLSLLVTETGLKAKK
ncbi:MFS transporter [Flavobacterium agricola]|uniref:Lysosomal dipeptide transporter MFSD1 n=1 Tax=Flavobacterium agricola TaxID=2870839 RepID=A0ABY6M2J4_9FLAO|nr:MFS transporter [Flavobacterium agricola]UYW02492.1 MFS transporter [Flavobacterium agricola]